MTKPSLPNKNEEYEDIEEKLRQDEPKPPMPKSGRSIFTIQKLRRSKPEDTPSKDFPAQNRQDDNNKVEDKI